MENALSGVRKLNEMINKFFDIPPYSLSKTEKSKLVSAALSELTLRHYENCAEYRRMLDAYGFNPYAETGAYEDIPFLPVRLFKDLDLKSVPDTEVFKTLTSSGTTGQSVSRIYLDRETAVNQQRALIKIMSDFLGQSRLPMMIIDCPSVVKDRKMFSARGAGILGYSLFGADKVYALDDDMRPNLSIMRDFLEKHDGERIFVFGFTFMVWQHFCRELQKESQKIDLSNGILFHIGGWKKLIGQNISPVEYKKSLKDVCNISEIHDNYGMTEQTGSIYIECEQGHFHVSIFSDVIARRANDLSVCEYGEKGLIEVISVLPKSYPGHILLTEDEGVVLGEDDCPCGRKGKYFKILGRIAKAELRGCSDTYAESF